jgi:mono/diheme cytochrome c family protein
MGLEDGSPDLVAFAWTEVAVDRDRSALMLVGSSGTISVVINGKTTFHSDNASGRAYAPDSDVVCVELVRGRNQILVKARQRIGMWSFSLQISDPLPVDVPTQSGGTKLEQLRAFGLRDDGDPKRGEAIFFDADGIGCARCHSAGGRGNAKIGPDLTGLALKYDRAEIIRSVLEPSSRIVTLVRKDVKAAHAGPKIGGLPDGADLAPAGRYGCPSGFLSLIASRRDMGPEPWLGSVRHGHSCEWKISPPSPDISPRITGLVARRFFLYVCWALE